nr:PREDICTED: alpha-protein kinase 1-like [Daucus carota subsp. sativus]
MGSVTQRSIHQNEKVECYYPRFLMLFLNDKMNEADRNMYVDSPVVPILRTCAKIQTRLVNKKKHENVPLVVTPFMLEQFSAPHQPVQVPDPLQQMAPEQQQQQQQQPEQQNQPQQQQPHQQDLQLLLLIQDYQSSSQSSQHSPYNPPYNSPYQSPHQSPYNSPHQSQNQSPQHYKFFPEQQSSIFPSQSEPIPSPTHTHHIPQHNPPLNLYHLILLSTRSYSTFRLTYR